MAHESASIAIILLDPDRGDTTLLSQLLSEEGFRVVTPALDASLLEKVEEERPDLVIADPFAGEWDPDLTILRDLRRRPQLRDIPLIICTGNAAELFFRQGTLTALLKARTLSKPFTREQLLATVRSGLEGRAV